MAGTIIHTALVILSEAKDPFQVSEITNKTVTHFERDVILNLIQDPSGRGPSSIDESFFYGHFLQDALA